MTDAIMARRILGYDFIHPLEIDTARSLTYTEAQYEELERTIPDRETLEWLRQNDHMLVAGPPRDMSLLDVRELERRYFYSKEGGWFAEPQEVFARTEQIACHWYMIRKGIVPNSTSQRWNKQKGLLSDLETVPTAVELVWVLTCYKAVRNIYLLESLNARTGSVYSRDHRVAVGDFGEAGLRVGHWLDSIPSVALGLASARKAA